MIILLSNILFIIFTILSLIHFYWLFGGLWGLKKAIPTNNKGVNTLAIPKFATLIVALGLGLFGLIYLNKSGFTDILNSFFLIKYAYFIIPAIFLLRAIGEFNYVGLFKKIKHTEFAKADSKLFIPLCLCIWVIGLLILVLGK